MEHIKNELQDLVPFGSLPYDVKDKFLGPHEAMLCNNIGKIIPKAL
jgi:hypothetical protein